MREASDAIEVIAMGHPDLYAAACAAGTAAPEDGVLAVVNHDRWIVSCPDCNSAQMGAPSDPRFWCVECSNGAVGGMWRPVTYPPAEARDEIADELRRRLVNTQRNWLPGETVDDLAAELEAFNEAAATAAADEDNGSED